MLFFPALVGVVKVVMMVGLMRVFPPQPGHPLKVEASLVHSCGPPNPASFPWLAWGMAHGRHPKSLVDGKKKKKECCPEDSLEPIPRFGSLNYPIIPKCQSGHGPPLPRSLPELSTGIVTRSEVPASVYKGLQGPPSFSFSLLS